MNKIDLTINNRRLTYSFGLGFIGELLDSLDMTLNEVASNLQTNSFKFIPLVMFESAKYALLREGKEVDFDRFNISDDIESDGGLSDKRVLKFVSMFGRSLSKDVPVDEDEAKTEGTEKK